MDNKINNSEAYGTIRWILDNGDMGFFFVITTPPQQKKVANLYNAPNVAVYDYADTSAPFSYHQLSDWAQENKDKDVFFILSMDIALREEDHMASFNMSRDLLAHKEKMWFFFMTEDVDNRLGTFAYDFYSYVRLKVRFSAEEAPDIGREPILQFENRYNTTQVKETLDRYKALEERYMQMPLDGGDENQLLSAAVALTDIAILYRDYADDDNALRIFEKVKEIREGILGEDHPDTAETYNNIAFMYSKLNEYAMALEWNQKALVIKEKVLGKEHPDTATTYNNIAFMYGEQGEYASALEWHQKALVIKEKVLGLDHPDTGTTYNNIANVYAKRGEYAAALAWHRKALVIREKILGLDHPLTAATYNNIAATHNNQGEYTKAMEWFHRALGIYEKVLGLDHLETAITYNNIAAVCANQGDYAKALESLQKTLDIREKRLGINHPYTQDTLEGIATLKQHLHKN